MGRDPGLGLNGDNVTSRERAMPWYDGPSLLEHLETVPLDSDDDAKAAAACRCNGSTGPTRFPRLCRPDRVAGRRPGRRGPDPAVGPATRIERIVTLDGDSTKRSPGQSVTLTLADEVDCSRGDVIAAADDPPEAPTSSRRRSCGWRRAAAPGRGYWLKLGTQTVTATVQHPKYEINVNTLEHLAAQDARLNEIGVAEIATDREIVFEPYAVDGIAPQPRARRLHPDRQADQRDGRRGMLHFALRRAQTSIGSISTSAARRTPDQGPEAGGAVVHRPVGAGKSTIANSSRRSCTRAGGTPSCSTATMSATGSTATSASPRPTGSRISAASARSRG
jgi:bifunctional enzyme CysN/CysC